MPWVVIGQELLEDLGRKEAFHLAKETHRWLTGKHRVGELFGRDAPYNYPGTSYTVIAAELRHVHLRPDPVPRHISSLVEISSPALSKYIGGMGRIFKDALNWSREANLYISAPPEPRMPGDFRTFRMTSDFSVVFGDLETNSEIHGEDAAGSIILVHAPESEHEFHSDRFQLIAAAEMLDDNRDLFRKRQDVFYFANEKDDGSIGIFATNPQ